MLAQSQVLPQLRIHSFDTNDNVLCIYGDPAYPATQQIQSPYRGAMLTALQKERNKSMSQVRVSVEWIFGDIVNYFKFLDLKKIENTPECCWKNVYNLCTATQF